MEGRKDIYYLSVRGDTFRTCIFSEIYGYFRRNERNYFITRYTGNSHNCLEANQVSAIEEIVKKIEDLEITNMNSDVMTLKHQTVENCLINHKKDLEMFGQQDGGYCRIGFLGHPKETHKECFPPGSGWTIPHRDVYRLSACSLVDRPFKNTRNFNIPFPSWFLHSYMIGTKPHPTHFNQRNITLIVDSTIDANKILITKRFNSLEEIDDQEKNLGKIIMDETRTIIKDSGGNSYTIIEAKLRGAPLPIITNWMLLPFYHKTIFF